jgi:DNA-binding MarR family transcriptional regulator
MTSKEDDNSLTSRDKEILSKLSEIGKASMYALAKEANLPYSTTFNSVKKLESLNLIKEFQEEETESDRKKIIYILTENGASYLSGLFASFDVGTKQPADLDSDPLSNNMIEFLLSQRRETSEVDFKSTLDTRRESDFANVAKDIFAMSNYGGGFLIIGFKETETGSFEPTGMPQSFHVDQAQLQEKFNAYSNSALSIGYREIAVSENCKFAVIYVPPSPVVLKPIKNGRYENAEGKAKTAFLTDEILFRRGTQSIRATEDEIKFIERRSRETEYKISLLNGMPDRVKENLFSNFFEITKICEDIYSAELPQNIRFSPFETPDITFVRQNDNIYSFCDISKEPFGRYLKVGSFQKCSLNDFCSTQDKRIILTWLLNQEVRSTAIKMGFRYDRRNKNLFFFPIEPHLTERYEIWEGRFKKSKRLVARKLSIETLGSSVFAHSGASISFSSIGSDFYLKVTPEIVLTHDGYETIQGIREGATKTRLIYNQYNVSYLNLILFWVSKFKSSASIMNFNNRVLVSSEPITVTLNVGIRSDRPSEEFSRRKDELYSLYTDEEDDLP